MKEEKRMFSFIVETVSGQPMLKFGEDVIEYADEQIANNPLYKGMTRREVILGLFNKALIREYGLKTFEKKMSKHNWHNVVGN